MTRPPNSLQSQRLRQVLHGYLRLHQLTVEERDDSSDADTVRDSLDHPWRDLTEAERERVQGLSADLFAISDAIQGGQQETNTQGQKCLADALEAKQRGEWDRALTLLRRSSNYITPAHLSYFRGEIWLEAGYPEVGVVFYELAAKLEPDNPNYALHYLHASGPRARQMMKAR